MKYWREDYDTLYSRSQVYILGNPIVSWVALLGVVLFGGISTVALRYREVIKAKWPRFYGHFPAAR